MIEPGFISLPGGQVVYGWELKYVGDKVFAALKRLKTAKWVSEGNYLAYQSRKEAVAAMITIGISAN